MYFFIFFHHWLLIFAFFHRLFFYSSNQVTITPEVTSRGVNRAVMGQLVNLYRQSILGGRLPAYDGRKSLYTAGPLPFSTKEFNIILLDEEDSPVAATRSIFNHVFLLFICRYWCIIF